MQRLFIPLVARSQVRFFRDNKAGCTFAAYAARHPRKYGWEHRAINSNAAEIDAELERAILDPSISTLSLVFKRCRIIEQLLELTEILQQCRYVFLGQEIVHHGYRCLGFRARVGVLESWVSGFGPFAFFPKTRQTPYTEIAFRVKPRPDYKKVMKKAPDGSFTWLIWICSECRIKISKDSGQLPSTARPQ